MPPFSHILVAILILYPRLIYRAIELKAAIASRSTEPVVSCRSEELKQPRQVIEVYPYASKVRLFGKNMPKKATLQGIAFLRERLGDILPALRPYLAGFGHDLCDAAIAAYTAFLYRQNMVDALGISEEGLIFIPH